jgi:hypothetical protein
MQTANKKQHNPSIKSREFCFIATSISHHR